jgi:phosphoglycerate kinase
MSFIPTIRDLDLEGKRVLIRVDFNVPMDKSGNISDDSRIVAALPTIQYSLEKNARVILMSHFGRPKEKEKEFSLLPIAKRLSELLKKPVIMAPDCIGKETEALVASMKPKDVLLLENVRFYTAEEKPKLDPSFAKSLASLGDVYINDAFGTAHRAHSSTYEVAKFFPGKAGIGFLMEKEVEFLGRALLNPKKPFYAIIGGAKVSTKIGVLKSLIGKVDGLFIGGAMAFTFFKAQGKEIGASLFEADMLETAREILALCKEKGVPLYLPLDIVAARAFDNSANFDIFDPLQGIPEGFQGMDIGDKTVAKWKEVLQGGKTILWNGPVGVFEFKNFAKGTDAIAKLLASCRQAITIAGGGETCAAIGEAGLSSSFSHISTGGGASLEYIEQGTLPGLDVLSKKQ